MTTARMLSDGRLSIVRELSPKEINENKHIQAALEAGFENPFLNDQREILFPKYNGKEYRRFIEKFVHVPHSKIFENQVRQLIVDESYCKEELIPKIERDGLLSPIWVTPNGNSYSVDHGHHRRYSHKLINGPESQMPCFVLSSEVYPILENGQYGPAVSSQFMYELSKITCNPPAPNKIYTYKDVPVHLRKLQAVDPKFNGVNESGVFPDRKVFDKIMDAVYPNDFLVKSTRTRIFNLWRGGNSGSKIKPVEYSDVTNDLVMHGLDPGAIITKSGKRARKKFLEWIDDKTGSYLGCGNTNATGATFERDFVLPLIKSMGDKSINKKDKIHIISHITVYNPKATLVKLNEQRVQHQDILKSWNNRFAALGYSNVKFTKIIWPKQLVDNLDQTKLVIL